MSEYNEGWTAGYDSAHNARQLQINEAERDAARYRWLRVWFPSLSMGNMAHPDELDAAVDAAVAAEGETAP